jgi:hypothetical protein
MTLSNGYDARPRLVTATPSGNLLPLWRRTDVWRKPPEYGYQLRNTDPIESWLEVYRCLRRPGRSKRPKLGYATHWRPVAVEPRIGL